MLRNWVNFLLMAAAAAFLLVASGVPAASATAHAGDHLSMPSPCGAMDMDMSSGKTALPSAKNHCAVGCMMPPFASVRTGEFASIPDLAPCLANSTALTPTTLALDPPPPRR